MESSRDKACLEKVVASSPIDSKEVAEVSRKFGNSRSEKHDVPTKDDQLKRLGPKDNQDIHFRQHLFVVITCIIAGFAIASTVFTFMSYFILDSKDSRYVIIAYMSTMIIEIIGVMQIVAKSIFPICNRD